MRIAKDWQDYSLMDASKGERLERWGNVTLVRPDPQIIWDVLPPPLSGVTLTPDISAPRRGEAAGNIPRSCPKAGLLNIKIFYLQ